MGLKKWPAFQDRYSLCINNFLGYPAALPIGVFTTSRCHFFAKCTIFSQFFFNSWPPQGPESGNLYVVHITLLDRFPTVRRNPHLLFISSAMCCHLFLFFLLMSAELSFDKSTIWFSSNLSTRKKHCESLSAGFLDCFAASSFPLIEILASFAALAISQTTFQRKCPPQSTQDEHHNPALTSLVALKCHLLRGWTKCDTSNNKTKWHLTKCTIISLPKYLSALKFKC